jgi:hypothetical protein
METRTIVRKITKSLDVNLSLTSETDKMISSYKGIGNSFKKDSEILFNQSKVFNEAKKTLDKLIYNAQTSLSKYGKSYDETGALINKIASISEQLGIKRSEVPGYNELDKIHIELAQGVNMLKDVLNKINK